MTPEQLRRVQDVFEAALEEEEALRPQYLDRVCGDDEALRRSVDALFASDSEERGVLPEPFVRPSLPPLFLTGDATQPQTRSIGPYEVLTPIGWGGTSVVFLVERGDDPRMGEMALKLVVGGFAAETVEARFRSELRILQNLDHPSMVRLLDVGRSDEGWPYFVMEYVDGVPVTEYCDANDMPIDDRLALFTQICAVVQYAHQNLVVHRDLKPSNILIDGEGRAKLLDFGIAKLLDPADRGEPTEPSSRFLTPSIAAPEHLRGDRVTTASDVYSLGVLLYELLTGNRPFEWGRDTTRDEMLAQMESLDPLPPSVVAGGSALQRRLRGDLDNIVLRAVRFDPRRRYGSVRELSEDIERHLCGQPVSARPLTRLYRWSRFLRRNRLAVANAALIGTLLVVLAVTSLLASQRLERERDAAEAQRARAERVTEYLVEAFELTDPSAGLGQRVTAKEILDRGSRRLAEDSAADPETRASLQHTLGKLYVGMGLYREAEQQLLAALSWRRTAYGSRDARTAETLHELAAARSWLGDLAGATRAAAEALAIRNELGEERHVAASLRRLGDLEIEAGRYPRAESMLRHALTIHRRETGDVSPEVARDLTSLTQVQYLRGDYAAAERTARDALRVSRQVFPAGSLVIAENLGHLAGPLAALGGYDEAETLYGESLEQLQLLLGPRHARVAAATADLGDVALLKGELGRAEALLRHSIELMRGALGEDHAALGGALANLGWTLMAQNRLREAIATIDQALELHRRIFGDDHPLVGEDLHFLGSTLFLLGDLDPAETNLRGALAIRTATSGRLHKKTAETHTILGRVLRERGRFVEAEQQYQLGLEAFRHDAGDERWLIAIAEMRLAEVLCDQGRPEEAESMARRALASFESSPEPAHLMRAAEARGILGTALGQLGRPEPARQALLASYRTLVEAKGVTAKQTVEAVLRLVRFFDAQGEMAEATRYRSLLPSAPDPQ